MKKLISLLICITLTLSLVPASADETDTRFGVLKTFEIMQGYSDGSLGLDRLVTRAEFTKMAISASSYRTLVTSSLSVSPFPDVTYEKWYAPYVYLGVTNGLLQGYKDGTFKPDNTVLYEEACAIILRLLGYSDDDFAYSWPTGQIMMAEKSGICDGANAKAGQALTRDQVSHLFYNLLNAQTISGSDYILSLNHNIISDIVLTSSYLQTDTLKKGFVNTSSGVYEVTDSFDYSLVGLRGDAVIKNKTIISFLPESTNREVYNIFSVSGQNLILFKNGEISNYKLQGTETLYCDGTKTTVSAMTQSFSPGDVIELHRDKNGTLQYVIYSENALEGPIVIKGSNWYEGTGLAENATTVRDGQISSLSSLQVGDVVYYSSQLQSVWATDDKVSGIFEQALPNSDQISQIKLSGTVYNIDSVDAFKKLSSGGEYKPGDRVTLILDRDGNVCDVLDKNMNEELIGYMLSGGNKEFTNTKGESYSSPYVTLLLSNNTTVTYESIKDYTNYYKNAMVKVTFQNGKVSLSEAKSSVYGTFSAAYSTLGNIPYEPNIEIVDIVRGTNVTSSAYTKVFPQRIDGLSLSNTDILYAGKNSNGKINTLFPNNVTGDAFSYGIVTKAETTSGHMNISGNYTYFDKSSQLTARTSGKAFSVYAGTPVQIKNTQSGVETMIKLATLGCVNNFDYDYFTIDGKKYQYLSDIAVYFKNGNDYQAITIDELKEYIDKNNVTAYAESTNPQKTRVRVVVVNK